MKWFGFRIGYTKGMDIINSGSGDEVIKRISGAATVLGLCVAGCLVSTTVKLSVPLEFASGDGKIVVQELIDKIMPCFLPVLAFEKNQWQGSGKIDFRYHDRSNCINLFWHFRIIDERRERIKRRIPFSILLYNRFDK